MYSLHMLTSKQKSVFFKCVSKCRVIHSSKNYLNVRLSKRFYSYKICAAVRNWYKIINLQSFNGRLCDSFSVLNSTHLF